MTPRLALLPLVLATLIGGGQASAQAVPGRDFVIVVGAGSPYETLAELVQVGRSADKGLRCGAGRGAPTCEVVARSTGVKVETILYKGSGAMVNDAASNQLDFGVLTIDEARDWTPKGKVRALK